MRAPTSLNAQLALVIGLLAGIPNLAFALLVLVPQLGGVGALGVGGWALLLGWTALVVAASAAIGSWLTRSLLRPLNRLAGALRERAGETRRAGGGGLAALPLDDEDPDEIRTLTAAFNALLARVRTERTRRDAFMATIAHDLKTPLVATGTLLGVIRDNDNLTREERVDLASRLETENRAVLELVQTLLDAYRYEQRSVAMRREEVALGALLTRVAERVRPLAEARGVTVDIDGDATARVDPGALERALYNLVANAARYAERGIAVQIYNNLVRIADDGPGLPEPLEQLAEPFASREISIGGESYAAGSSGMGLFIARRILEMHGGRLVCERSDARGTALLAYLGAGRAEPAEDAA